MSCCHPPSCHADTKPKRDYLLIVSSSLILFFYTLTYVPIDILANAQWLGTFASAIHNLVNTMAWGVLLGIMFMGVIGRVPREFVISILGEKAGVKGILRASLAGVLLDLCSHGILMVGAKLYERGASTAQVMAFLISSPWNSFSFTLILWAMVGFKWMLTFLLLSMLIAIVSGLIFEQLEKRKVLPANPNRIDLPDNFDFFAASKEGIKSTKFDAIFFRDIVWNGLLDSRMVLRWIFFGVIIASLIRASLSPEMFQTWFGATLAGLGLTLLVATIMEVCSEGTLPVAADLLTRANAPGNSLTFLMAGVSTDYTEMMVLKETTKGWKIPLFLPLVTLPQILIIAIFLNSTV
ncbi:MAG: ATPase [Gammaproteobacteria bacterium]|jgi:uncharacterized protein|nr:ATPase [Gammaproteobacteria bacterium]